MRVLLVGSGGYLGIPLAERLSELGHTVFAGDRYFFGKYPHGENIKRVHLDIRTYIPTAKQDLDAVIDLAGLSNDATAEIDPDLTRAINFVGAAQLATIAKRAGIRRYIYASSASVYGATGELTMREFDECKPLTVYAECKARVEDHIRPLAGRGFEPVILRNATVFGMAERMRFDLVVNQMTRKAWKDGVIEIHNGGEQWRPLVAVDDVVDVFCHVLDAPTAAVVGQTFNVGSQELNYRIKHIAWLIHRTFEKSTLSNVGDAPDKRGYRLAFDAITKLMPRKKWIGVLDAVEDIRTKLNTEPFLADDPTTMTLSWYKGIMDDLRKVTP